MNGLDTAFVVSGSAILQIVTIDDRDDNMVETHSLNGGGEVFRLARVGRFGGPEGFHAAKATAARAFFAGDHERCGATRPAIIEVRAACFFAHSVQAMLGDGAVRRIEN